ncbi:MAG: multicopper oxidase domain-containing protein [Methanothrix sp.]|nr:multicopper oxidase domain-containing protein [Methanothrix sp.]
MKNSVIKLKELGLSFAIILIVTFDALAADEMAGMGGGGGGMGMGATGGSMSMGGMGMGSMSMGSNMSHPPGTINASEIPKYVNQLSPIPVYVPILNTDPATGKVTHLYTIDMTQFREKILPDGTPLLNNTDGRTTVWGYGGMAKDAVTDKMLGFVRNSPSPTFEAVRGIPVNVTWVNKVHEPYMFAIDPTLHWANPTMMPMHMEGMPPYPPFPPGYNGTPYVYPDGTIANKEGYDAQRIAALVPHLHGAEVRSTSDGYPTGWFTADGMRGENYTSEAPTADNATVYIYPNTQQATTLWYHDHGMGITRINVMSGLAGFYLLRDPADKVAPLLPRGKYEMPLAIQDRTFKENGDLWFPTEGSSPSVHPYWNAMFFGNTIMVNGLVWPNLNVDRGWYRLRLLDGSNARAYRISLYNTLTREKIPFTQIGSDGGYLKFPVSMSELLITPGERADILVDFSSAAVGTKIIMNNTATAPYPMGSLPDQNTVGQIMQFTVTDSNGYQKGVSLISRLPKTLNPTLSGAYPNLPTPSKKRTLTLIPQGVGGMGSMSRTTSFLLDGQRWMRPVSESPKNGETEEWQIVNPSMDMHPIHLHLVQFQVVSRQSFAHGEYMMDWIALNGQPPLDHPTKNLNLASYLSGSPRSAEKNEMGWKDTVQADPMTITTIRVRFKPQDGTEFPFDPTVGPGYVWHCHILDHEDDEMMRPYNVTA